MRTFKSITIAAATLALSCGLSFGAHASAAQAAPAAAGGTAPACVARVVDEQPDGQHVWVQNNCGKTMHIKIIVDGASDTGCNTLKNGQSREWVLKLGSYHKTVVC